MIFIRTRSSLLNDLVAVPWLVVVLLSFFTEHMANVIAVSFFKFLNIHLLSELHLPELDRFVHVKTQSLEEKTELQSAEMLQVMLVPQVDHESFHARREVLSRVVVEV